MNRLADESSPYLRQHRDNPVDWYPWGEPAFARARAEDRPILLSVGYSACHWCHVMAHESFENPELAEIQNRLFVNVKVDREERPDVDRVYMDALQALTGGGGWPMTVFLLPDGRPFFAGTYYPPEDRPGLPGFRRVMESLAAAYHERPKEVVASAERLGQALAPAPLVAPPATGPDLRGVLDRAERRLLESADERWGGFGGAPKFPQCPVLDFLLTRAVLEGPGEAAEAVQRTLRAMARGGIRDQVGEGFHRYSVDERWAVPHFEKMLYDNAQLVRLYLRSWQAHQRPEDLDLARRTADFLIDQLGLEGGGFAASLDADTGQGEGAYYAWSEADLEEALGSERAELTSRLFGGPGAAQTERGDLVLRGGEELDPAQPAQGQLREEMVRELAEVRGDRPPPGRDQKLIVGWNALAITALCELAVVLDEPSYLAQATRAAERVMASATVDGRLAHLFDGSQGRFTATLDDLAGMGLAALSLHEAGGEARWFQVACELAERVEADYADRDGPGWFDVPAGHDPNLRVRPRSLEDGAQPGGTSLMAELCLRLHGLSGEDRWRARALEVLAALAGAAERYPFAFGSLLAVMAVLDAGQVELALICPETPQAHWPLLRRARARLRPRLVVAVARLGSGQAEAQDGAELARHRSLEDGAPTAYVCQNFVCRLPVRDGDGLDRELGDVEIA
ncbi:MAG TPA: thioredoxin domain-containing protein [Candidatus Dormibacteraeota bacterium]